MKVNEIKTKVASKISKAKDKVAKKCGKAAKCASLVFCLASLVLAAGCQNPAQRAQTADTRLVFNINEGATGTTFTFGNEFVSLAQSNETGGNDAGLVASPTTDTKPEIAVGVGGSSAGVGQSGAAKQGVGAAIGSAVEAVSGLFTGGSSDSASATSATATAPSSSASGASQSCPDGNCGECPGGVCSPGECAEGECKPAQ